MPFVSKMKGKMSHLLKQKSKIGVKSKERVQYDVFDFGKRNKDQYGNMKPVPVKGNTT